MRGIVGLIGHRRFKSTKHGLPKSKFSFDPEANVYYCPGGQVLTYRTTNREGYREYKNNPGGCLSCPFFGKCTTANNAQKTITRHVWEDDRERLREYRLSEWGKETYKRRKETIERSFADAKELHGLRYARMRGINRVREQCLMTAAAQNIKKLALILDRRERRALCA